MESKSSVSFAVSISWAADKKETTHFKDVNADNITETIALAQKQILEEENSAEVSQSIIDVHLTGPNYYDLTLIDLPGVVRTVGKGESQALI